MKYRAILPTVLLALCAAALMVACGNALSSVFVQLRGPSLFLGL